MAKELIERLPNVRDKIKAMYWVNRAVNLNANIALVKKNRNEFFSFFLDVVRDTLFEAALRNCRGMYLSQRARVKLKEEIRLLGTGCMQTYILDQVLMKRGPKFMSRWSNDKRTYVAMQPIVGSGALVYMAVSKNGWTTSRQEPIDILKSQYVKEF